MISRKTPAATKTRMDCHCSKPGMRLSVAGKPAVVPTLAEVVFWYVVLISDGGFAVDVISIEVAEFELVSVSVLWVTISLDIWLVCKDVTGSIDNVSLPVLDAVGDPVACTMVLFCATGVATVDCSMVVFSVIAAIVSETNTG